MIENPSWRALVRTAIFLAAAAIARPTLAQDESFPPVEARAAGARVIELRDDPLHGRVALLDRGRRHGVERADRFQVLRAERPVGELKIEVVFDDISLALIVSGEIASDDVAVHLRAKGEPLRVTVDDLAKGREGRILDITESGLGVLISLGRRDGLEIGDRVAVLDAEGLPCGQLIVAVLDEGSARTRLESLRTEYKTKGLELGQKVRRARRLSEGGPEARDPEALRKAAAELRLRAAKLEAEAKALRERADKLERDASTLAKPASPSGAPRRGPPEKAQ
jgi:hypothetical protein